MLIGYARVSKSDQNRVMQRDALIELDARGYSPNMLGGAANQLPGVIDETADLPAAAIAAPRWVSLPSGPWSRDDFVSLSNLTPDMSPAAGT